MTEPTTEQYKMALVSLRFTHGASKVIRRYVLSKIKDPDGRTNHEAWLELVELFEKPTNWTDKEIREAVDAVESKAYPDVAFGRNATSSTGALGIELEDKDD